MILKKILVYTVVALVESTLTDPNIIMMARQKNSLEETQLELMTDDDYDVLYGLYTQYTRGDAPIALFGLEALAGPKHCAWANFRGTSKEECVQLYKQRVTQIMSRRTKSF